MVANGWSKVQRQCGFGLLLSAGLLGSTLLTACVEERKYEPGVGTPPDAGDGESQGEATASVKSSNPASVQNSSTNGSPIANSNGPGVSSASGSTTSSGDGQDSGGTAACSETAQGCSSADAGGEGETAEIPTGSSAGPASSSSAGTAGSSSASTRPTSSTNPIPTATANATGSAGSGGTAMLASDTASVSLNLLEVGKTSTPVNTWKVENRGTQPSGLPMLTNTNATELIVSSNTCTASLAPGSSCNIGFAFRPSSAGSRTGKITLAATQSGAVALTVTATGGNLVTVTVVGGGTGASVISSPAGINCGSSCTTLMSGSVTLTATTTNGSNLLHTGWAGDNIDCKAPSRDCVFNTNQPQAVTVRFAPLTQNLIFATSTFAVLTKGSAAAFDADCNAAATAGGINNAAGNDFIALVSDSASSVRTRLGATARGWIRMDGAPFADTQTSLFTDQKVLNAVRFDEFGRRMSETLVITGSSTAGMALSASNCENWTSDLSTKSWRGGTTTGGPDSWLSGGNGACNIPRGLMCMGKSRTAPVTYSTTSGRRIWISNTVFAFTGTPDQQCQAERPSGVSKARALIATTTQTAASVLDAAATYVRPDGMLVGTGAELTTGTELATGPWQMGNLTYTAPSLSFRVWTGQTTLTAVGTAESTCNNWTSNAGTGNWGSGRAVDTWWNTRNNTACNLDSQLYCVEVP